MAHMQSLAEIGMVKSSSRCQVNNHGQVTLDVGWGRWGAYVIDTITSSHCRVQGAHSWNNVV